MKETKKPAVRFHGFSNEWEQYKVGELIEDYTEKTIVQNQYPVLTSSQQQGIVRQEEYFADRQVTTNDNIGYFVLPFGYFTYRSRSDTDVFVFNRNDLIDKGIISYYYPVFVPKACDSNFLLRRLNYGIRKQLSMAAEGTGQKVLAHGKFKDMIVDVPAKEEQIKIGSIFEDIDNLITHRQSKLEKLQDLKASMLEKMFPKDGADVPEIRFRGFSRVWKTICLKDITSEITRTDKTSYAPIMMITAASGFIDQADRYSFDNAGHSLAKYIVLKKGELAYNHGASKLRPYGSCFALEVDEARIPYVYHCFTISDHNPYFISRVLNNKGIEKQLRRLVTSGARMDGLLNISYEEYTTIKIQLPEKDEQDKIVAYFKNIENLIDFSQQELNKLQSIKKVLLEKMFV
ncbi:restriction endonuclease subunit S [Clostridium sp. D33t1_170424_F3]|uniref:restriction endonuclease subunit S n=1 Tax=Clostridium sp. D33t1_170424_F3 TaxID=2787099 RepID=UPI0018AA1CA3|nr:restriction endonuclease subunit S [Clostridium sp. D33t1_170424_F3]